MTPLLANLGTTEIILIIVVIVLLFGARKLPELARGSGRALRIFKAETRGLMDDEDLKTDAERQIESMKRDADDSGSVDPTDRGPHSGA
ncbi:MAG: twin-arginine translocase TatA/TatE family subunit [Nocardioides sp.]